jgi:hypothetical protein
MGARKNKELKIPVELCFYVVREKMIPEFKVYILLKMLCSGKIRLDGLLKERLSAFCGYKSVKSFNNKLYTLRQIGWVGYNKSTGIYFIRGFVFVQKRHQLFKRSGFWFTIQDMQHFDGVIYGAVIGYLSKNQGKMRRAEHEKGSSHQTLCKSPGFYPISNRSLAKILNISVSTASIMKTRAEEASSITIKRKRILEPATHDVYKRLMETYPERYLQPIMWKGRFYQRLPDLVKAELKFGTRKKIEQ